MIPAQFDYVRAGSVDEAVAALGRARRRRQGAGRRAVADPAAAAAARLPEVVVDVGRVAELRGVREDGDHIVIGAMTTHDDVHARPAGPRARRADRRRRPRRSPTRRCGTAAPSAARSRTPTRPVTCRRWRSRSTPSSSSRARAAGARSPAADFFVDYLQTALAPDEVLVEVRVPKLGAGWGYHYEKFHRVAQAWAIVGVAAAVRRDERLDRRGAGRR